MAHQSYLTAVNTILSNIGQAPVTSVDTPNPLVQLARIVLEEVTREVQSEGWVFNTEENYPFIPDNNGDIFISENILALDISRFDERQVVIRQGRLYDKTNHTYRFTGKIEAHICWLFDFPDLPQAFKNYITLRAANLFAARSIGSTEVVKYSEKEENIARAAVMEYETQQGDYNMLGAPNGRSIVRGYMPINTVYRY